MRKLLNTLYIMSEDVYLTLDGENVVVKEEESIKGRFPLHLLESIVSFSYKGASPALMGACAERNILFAFYNPRGRFLARVVGEPNGNVLLRKEQYRISDDEALSVFYAKNMLLGKIFNSRWCLERTIRDYAMRLEDDKMKFVSDELYRGLDSIRSCDGLDQVRGIEGELAARYFSVFGQMILNWKVKQAYEVRKPL